MPPRSGVISNQMCGNVTGGACAPLNGQMSIPPTGKQVTVTAIDINCIVGGKSVEHWLNMDTLGLLQQLGVMPAPGQQV